MKLSRERLLREAWTTGFRPESLEKVIRLIALLNGIFSQPFLRQRLVLTRVLSELPNAQTVEEIEALLPWAGQGSASEA